MFIYSINHGIEKGSCWKQRTCVTEVHYDCVPVLVHSCLCLNVNISQNTAHQGMTAPRPSPAIYGPHASC